MTAKELMSRHNENKNMVSVSLKLCEDFLVRYKNDLANETDERIFNAFENYVWDICFG